MNSIINLVKKTSANENSDSIGLHTFINPYSYLKIRKREELESFDFVYVDGIFLVLLFKIVGINVTRKSFDMTSLAKEVFQSSITNNRKVYFIGSTPESIEDFISVIRSNYPELDIVGYRNGYFRNTEERLRSIKKIIRLNSTTVIVGMGTPYQEKFLNDLTKAGWKGRGYTCGGFIHQTSTKLDYYPKFFDKFNLRWIYRIYDEPKLIKRYFFYYPFAICLLIFDFLRMKLNMR